jgi:hypothetical protein
MAYTVLVRIDDAGACPVVFEGGRGLPLDGGDGARYRFVREVATFAEVTALVAELRDEFQTGASPSQ